MDSINRLSPARLFVTAAAYAALNPKTLAFVVAGTFAIVESVSGFATQVVAALAFAVLASSSVTAPVVLASIAPQRFEEPLEAGGEWLRANGALITAALLVVLGVTLVYSAVTGLLGRAV